jgi:thioredoxin-like negative regulator of GroEL
MQRRLFTLAALGLLAAPRAHAAGPTFDKPRFAAAQAAGRPILLTIHADWCPTCAKQKPILSRLLADPAFKDIAAFNIDFDAEKELVRQFGVRQQSTIIIFHGKREVMRSTGATAEADIKAMLISAGS